jgi:hypothetical protein
MQQQSLLATKLYIPPIRPDLVSRRRLDGLLNTEVPTQRGSPGALTLISAPVGFGKTALVTQWLGSAGASPPNFDHDIIDGAPAARFLQRFKEIIEEGEALKELAS